MSGGPLDVWWSSGPNSDGVGDGELLLAAVANANLALRVMSAALVAIGIGQYLYKRWATAATTAWPIVALVVAVGIAGVMAGVVAPAMTEPFLACGVAASMVLLLPYPIVLLVAFRRQMVRASMIR